MCQTRTRRATGSEGMSQERCDNSEEWGRVSGGCKESEWLTLYVRLIRARTVMSSKYRYGVATISRLLKIIGLFCRV